jgi:hypothetical protein
MTEPLKPVPNDDLASRVAWRLDESIDQLYMVCTAIERHMEEESAGSGHLTRAAVTNLLVVINGLSETRETLGTDRPPLRLFPSMP